MSNWTWLSQSYTSLLHFNTLYLSDKCCKILRHNFETRKVQNSVRQRRDVVILDCTFFKFGLHKLHFGLRILVRLHAYVNPCCEYLSKYHSRTTTPCGSALLRFATAAGVSCNELLSDPFSCKSMRHTITFIWSVGLSVCCMLEDVYSQTKS
jgi:hypothetical protein